MLSVSRPPLPRACLRFYCHTSRAPQVVRKENLPTNMGQARDIGWSRLGRSWGSSILALEDSKSRGAWQADSWGARIEPRMKPAPSPMHCPPLPLPKNGIADWFVTSDLLQSFSERHLRWAVCRGEKSQIQADLFQCLCTEPKYSWSLFYVSLYGFYRNKE